MVVGMGGVLHVENGSLLTLGTGGNPVVGSSAFFVAANFSLLILDPCGNLVDPCVPLKLVFILLQHGC